MKQITIDKEKFDEFKLDLSEQLQIPNVIEMIETDGPCALKGSDIIEKGDMKLL